MSNQQVLSVETRDAKGSGHSQRLRRDSKVPGVYYNAKGENMPFLVEHTPLQKLYSQVGLSQVFQLTIVDQGQSSQQPAIIRDVQHHPVKGTISHVDFYGVDLARKIHVYIPVEITGKAKGVVLGGILEVFRDELEVVGLPLAIPEKIVIDVTSLEVNQNVHIQDLALPEDVEFIFEDNFAVVGVVSPTAGAQAGEAEGEEAAAGAE